MQRLLPTQILVQGVALYASVVMLALFVCLGLWSASMFVRSRTTVLPDRPATKLIIAGPFKITRNPLYVSLLLLYFAIALWLNSIWPFLFAVPLVVVLRHYVIRREEKYLERKFGADYVDYKNHVRRWL